MVVLHFDDGGDVAGGWGLAEGFEVGEGEFGGEFDFGGEAAEVAFDLVGLGEGHGDGAEVADFGVGEEVGGGVEGFVPDDGGFEAGDFGHVNAGFNDPATDDFAEAVELAGVVFVEHGADALGDFGDGGAGADEVEGVGVGFGVVFGEGGAGVLAPVFARGRREGGAVWLGEGEGGVGVHGVRRWERRSG